MGSVMLADKSLEGKLAIVTGGSRGIGAAIVLHLAAKGCSILLVYTSESSTKLAQDMCAKVKSEYSSKCFAVKADLNDPVKAAPEIISAAKKHYADPEGKLVINILINNAGVGGNYVIGEVPADEFHRQYAVNVLGPLMMTQECKAYLPNDRSGRIINLSSVSSSLGFVGQTLYGGTKAALDSMTRTWARELAEHATVNAINPGPVEGDMYYAAGETFWKQMESWQVNTPLSAVRQGIDKDELYKLSMDKMGGRRPAYGAEVAGIVGMLCRPESAWCTGSVVCANGGFRFST